MPDDAIETTTETDPADPEPRDSLSATAGAVGGHRFVERELFALTGRWSGDSDGQAPAASVFLATQSRLHAWRLAQWEALSPRSLDTVESPPARWAEALAAADSSGDVRTRLACWTTVLAPQLAARYLAHRDDLDTPAGAGMLRWIDIATTDVLRGVGEGSAVLVRVGLGDGSTAPTLEALVGPPGSDQE